MNRTDHLHIGIVIPTYNRATLIGETLESVLAQSRAADEIVVVDDGSTDNTRDVLAPFVRRGVRYVYQNNAHLSAARNRGEQELGPTINAVLFLDSDDRLVPDALERLAQALEATPRAPLAYGRPRFIGPSGQPTGRTWGFADFAGANVWDNLVERNFICTAGSVLLRRSAVQNANGFDTGLRRAEDWDMWLRLSERGEAFGRVATPSKPIIEYRVHAGTLSQTWEQNWPAEQAMLRAHLARPSLRENPVRHTRLEAVIARRDARLRLARDEGANAQDALLSPRHRRLRAVLDRLPIAGLYRRLPLSLRLTLRDRFGIDRSA